MEAAERDKLNERIIEGQGYTLLFRDGVFEQGTVDQNSKHPVKLVFAGHNEPPIGLWVEAFDGERQPIAEHETDYWTLMHHLGETIRDLTGHRVKSSEVLIHCTEAFALSQPCVDEVEFHSTDGRTYNLLIAPDKNDTRIGAWGDVMHITQTNLEGDFKLIDQNGLELYHDRQPHRVLIEACRVLSEVSTLIQHPFTKQTANRLEEAHFLSSRRHERSHTTSDMDLGR